MSGVGISDRGVNNVYMGGKLSYLINNTLGSTEGENNTKLKKNLESFIENIDYKSVGVNAYIINYIIIKII